MYAEWALLVPLKSILTIQYALIWNGRYPSCVGNTPCYVNKGNVVHADAIVPCVHYNDVIMSMITSLTIVSSTVYSMRRSKKTSKLRVTGFLRGIHRYPGSSPHKGPVTWKVFPFDDVIMSMVHQKPWYWVCNTGKFLFSRRNCAVSVSVMFVQLTVASWRHMET